MSRGQTDEEFNQEQRNEMISLLKRIEALLIQLLELAEERKK